MVTVVVTGHSSRRSTPPRWTPTGDGLQRGQFCWPPLGRTVGRQRAATWPPLGRISWPPTQLAADLQDPGQPEEINRLGRTITAWRTQISNWHAARVTNAPTEAANNLIKRVKRAAFGFTNFDNYRIRALLYAGKPNWALLETLTPT